MVDDDPGVLLLMRRTVEGLGYRVECASSRAEARERLRGHSFEALVSDVSMESADAGVLLAQEAGALSPGLSVILVSGAPEAKHLISISGAKTFDYLSKPFRLGDLASAVARALTPRSVAGRLSARRAQLGALFRAEALAVKGRGQDLTFVVWGAQRSIVASAELVSRAISHLLGGAVSVAGPGRRVRASLEFGDPEAVITILIEGVETTEQSWDLEPSLAIARVIFEGLGGHTSVRGKAFIVTLPVSREVLQ